jgi:hypothetical protein
LVEAGWDDHEQVVRGRLAWIADRMWDILGEMSDTPCLNHYELITNPDFQRPLQDVAGFDFAVMDMELVSGPRFKDRLEHIICATGFLASQFVRYGQKVQFRACLRLNNDRLCTI